MSAPNSLLPRDQIYRLLSEIMCEVLGRREAVWNTGTRLELIEGWNSNKTVTAMLALAQKLRRDFPLEALDQAGTVGDLVALAAGYAPSGATSFNPFAAYESLGESCEFGILQQYEGVMQPHLLRFASFIGHPSQRLSKLIAGLADDFARLAEPGLLEISLPEQEWDNAEKEYRILNTHYGLQIHTGFLVSAMSLNDAKRRMQDFPDSLTFLRKRLLHRLQTGGKRWLWKSAVLSEVDEIGALFAVLQKHGPNGLLWVTLGDAANPPPAVVKLRDNLYRGYIWKSDDPWSGDWSEGHAWVALLQVADTVVPAITLAPAVPPPPQSNRQALDEAYNLLNAIVAAQIDNPELVLGMEMRPADVDGWDSIKHINIILELESRLGVTFRMAELEAMLNVGDFVALIAGGLPRQDVPVGEHPAQAYKTSFVILNDSPADNHPATVIVSGLGNVGCLLAGEILNGCGIDSVNDKFVAALAACDYAEIGWMIAQQNADAKSWGLLLPSIHELILPGQLSLFRNPGLIFVMQDGVAVATETVTDLGSPQTARQAYLDTMSGEYKAADFLQKAECPTLILSYENILRFPDETIAAIAEFCGLTMTDDLRKKSITIITSAIYRQRIAGPFMQWATAPALLN
jgi:acyl carrier protein